MLIVNNGVTLMDTSTHIGNIKVHFDSLGPLERGLAPQGDWGSSSV